MKLAIAQMSMSANIDDNLGKTLAYIENAGECDLVFFPEIQLSPFFPQYEKKDVSQYLLDLNSTYIRAIQQKAKDVGIYVSPNVYLSIDSRPYDASLWINPDGNIEGISKMVHIMQAKNFYEQDYYTPSDDGFKVFDTPFGRVGIVICFDRHLPESIRTCAVKGAQLIIIPTANTKSEPLEMFEWELRTQAYQNNVFIAMCNRVGAEDKMDFCGESIVVSPDGDVIFKAGDKCQLAAVDIDLSAANISRRNRPYIETRRPEHYI